VGSRRNRSGVAILARRRGWGSDPVFRCSTAATGSFPAGSQLLRRRVAPREAVAALGGLGWIGRCFAHGLTPEANGVPSPAGIGLLGRDDPFQRTSKHDISRGESGRPAGRLVAWGFGRGWGPVSVEKRLEIVPVELVCLFRRAGWVTAL